MPSPPPAPTTTLTTTTTTTTSLPAHLPSPRAFITQLIASLRDAVPDRNHSNTITTSTHTEDADQQRTTTSNNLTQAPEQVKKALLSLHVIFPNEVLPALDLLDRGLVTKMIVQRNKPALGEEGEEGKQVPRKEDDEEGEDVIYYIRSAQHHRPSRYHSHTNSDLSATSYQVRLRTWFCSCPAFAFSAFPSVHPEPPLPLYMAPNPTDSEQRGEEAWKEWVFGGCSIDARNKPPPVCKHLLACVLGERCEGLFGGFVKERVVDVEAAAGWAAGWGD